MACLSASTGAGIYVEHVIAEGGQQIHHCSDPILHGYSKHIEIRYQLVWEIIENNLVKVESN
jgi:hypothetical protein